MVCRMLVLVSVLMSTRAALAEYIPGFSLYGHAATAESIVEVDISADGTATVVSVLAGRDPGKEFRVDPETLRFRPRPAGKRAILFLAGERPILAQAGVAWFEEKGVFTLPDNWGWCVSWPFEYRRPTVPEFKKGIATVRRDTAEVARISGMKPGDARARALSALIARPREGIDWYRFEGMALEVMLERNTTEYRDGQGDYPVELRIALATSLPGLAADERKILRDAAATLSPGVVRREHIALLSMWDGEPEEFELFADCFRMTADLAEQLVCAVAMLASDPGRAFDRLSSRLKAEEPELARGLLLILDKAAFAEPPRVPRVKLLDTVAGIADALPSVDGRMGASNLGYVVVGTLTRGGRNSDLPVLLDLARSKLACRAQALVSLHARFKCDWEKDDPRWDKAIRDLREK